MIIYVVLCTAICFYGFPLETTENDMENIIYSTVVGKGVWLLQ